MASIRTRTLPVKDRRMAATITEFLDARITEDGLEALDAPKMSDPYEANRIAFTGAMRHRALAECAAKRAIIKDCVFVDDIQDEYATGLRDEVLSHLAAVYKDHPDYRQEWALDG